jgi:cyclomaltodextrinase
MDIPMGIYRHYKGKQYLVIGIARHSETQEFLVVYVPLYPIPDNEVAQTNVQMSVRPLSMWLESVNGKPRFEFIGGAKE